MARTNTWKRGIISKVDRMHLCGLVVFFFVFFIPTFLAIQFGSEFVNNVVAAMPPVLTDGLKIASAFSGSWNGNAAEDDELRNTGRFSPLGSYFPSIWG